MLGAFGELADLLLGGGVNGGEGLAGDTLHEFVVDEQSSRKANRLSVERDSLQRAKIQGQPPQW